MLMKYFTKLDQVTISSQYKRQINNDEFENKAPQWNNHYTGMKLKI